MHTSARTRAVWQIYVIVTNGTRYQMYASGRGFEPLAYANLQMHRP